MDREVGVQKRITRVLPLRYLLVSLFFPASTFDKIFNFDGAVEQAKQVFPSEATAKLAIFAGMGIEVAAPLGILTGKADRLAAATMAAYCMSTALLFKRFWEPGDFWQKGESKGRDLFWDFLKNFSLAGGFLLITLGTRGEEIDKFKADPLSSTHPYKRH
jgi:putative oxidoreductase